MLPRPTAEPSAAMMKTVLCENRPRAIGAVVALMASLPPAAVLSGTAPPCHSRPTRGSRLLDGAGRQAADDVLLQVEEQRHHRDGGEHGTGGEHRVVRVRLLRDVAEQAHREGELV